MIVLLLLAPSGSPGEGTPSSQQQLAKPVPMRRPEKSVSQARVAMTNSYEASLYEHSAALYGHGRYMMDTQEKRGILQCMKVNYTQKIIALSKCLIWIQRFF